jgi:hypothetical protein
MPRLLVVGALVLVATACHGGGDDDPSGASTTVVRRTTADDAPLSVGDCGDVPSVTVGGALDPASFTSVDCATPHDVEIGAVFDMPAGNVSFPGRAAVDGYANEQCLSRFSAYVGADYEASSLDYYIVAPGSDGWHDGDRRMACVLYQTDFQPLTGSVEGSGL